MDLAVGEPGERRLLGGHERLGLAGALGQRESDRRLGEAEPVGVVAPLRLPPAGYHFPTPIWTSRNRAPLTAWPTWPPWPGSPLPQFGVPSIR